MKTIRACSGSRPRNGKATNKADEGTSRAQQNASTEATLITKAVVSTVRTRAPWNAVSYLTWIYDAQTNTLKQQDTKQEMICRHCGNSNGYDRKLITLLIIAPKAQKVTNSLSLFRGFSSEGKRKIVAPFSAICSDTRDSTSDDLRLDDAAKAASGGIPRSVAMGELGASFSSDGFIFGVFNNNFRNYASVARGSIRINQGPQHRTPAINNRPGIPPVRIKKGRTANGLLVAEFSPVRACALDVSVTLIVGNGCSCP
ncbi:unnamed protein product [Notodromas monacha]|uniref:Uncharacterized protein n=1 Tax=Notodromas monacha TaxID=399045 RepID=A0A7R9GG36_9CRUS|nr:unnamed protein product [Notodromas monacha]CAG0919777.1 unnamed protein product [Notodromas monacha]